MKLIGFLSLCLLLACALDADAQPPEPIGPYVIDVRGALARFKADPTVAGALAVDPENLPTRGLGVLAGAHWYPLRRGRLTFGLGGELVLARGSRTGGGEDTTVAGPVVTTSLTSVSPQISLNFGTHDGWSYISGGIGRARLGTERGDVPFGDAAGRVRTTNYGGGARWFTSPRLAFTFDVRFHTIDAQEPAGARPAYPRTRFMVISVGASLR